MQNGTMQNSTRRILAMFSKIVKYTVALGVVGIIIFSPKTRAIVSTAAEAAVSGGSAKVEQPSGPSAEEVAEERRQEQVTKAHEALIAEATAPKNQTVAGVKSQTNGFYLAKKVQGVAFAAPTGTTAGGNNGNSFVKVMDTDKKKSTAAVKSAEVVAQMLGGTVGPCINVNYGSLVNGKFTASTAGSASTMSIGVPTNFRQAGATYSIVAIYAGGSYKVFENTSTDPAVITVAVEEAESANVMYALVRR